MCVLCVCTVCLCVCNAAYLLNGIGQSTAPFCWALKRVDSARFLPLTISLSLSLSLPLVCGLLSMRIIPLSHCDSSRLRHSGCERQSVRSENIAGVKNIKRCPKMYATLFCLSSSRTGSCLRPN